MVRPSAATESPARPGAVPDGALAPAAAAIGDAVRVRRLVWRARRGLLENDIVLERFFKAYEGRLTEVQVDGLDVLLDLSDRDLLDLILGRKELEGETDRPDCREVLGCLRAL